MPVVDVTTDIEVPALTITAEFAAAVERVWAIYADPRQVEQIWGPPGYPATFVQHDFTVGGRATYYMTSPDGEKFGGWWRFTAIDSPTFLAFEDGFADADLHPVDDLPVGVNEYTFTSIDGGTRASYTTRYSSADELQKVLDMGMVEGATGAINQIDAYLTA